jgi:hypothetical protein
VPEKEPATQVVKNIRRATRRHFSAEDNIRIVLEGLRGNAWQRSRGSAATARLLLINSSFSLGARSAGPTAGRIIIEGRGQRTKFLSGQRTRCAAE